MEGRRLLRHGFDGLSKGREWKAADCSVMGLMGFLRHGFDGLVSGASSGSFAALRMTIGFLEVPLNEMVIRNGASLLMLQADAELLRVLSKRCMRIL